MKKVLIISPYFPPVNAPDMQRVRMSLPYFKELGWEPEVVTVDSNYTDINKDDLLLQSIPESIKIHKIKALNKKLTAKFGLGSIALRSLWYYKQQVNQLLSGDKYDLIYFSTTQFPVCVLGTYWKSRFKIPYVIDMQDPWHSEYYRDKPTVEQPPKYWFSYRLNKFLEPIALKAVDGLISVSESYITNLKMRYPVIQNIPASTITFGSFEPDMEIAKQHEKEFAKILNNQNINIVYMGRGGFDLHAAIKPVFEAFRAYLNNNVELAQNIKFYFIGTSYAGNGEGNATILPLARQYNIADNVIEITDRISFYHTLSTLSQADALFIPGSDDPAYTASKIYPYLLTSKPLLAIFHPDSPAIDVLKEFDVTDVYDYERVTSKQIIDFLTKVVDKEPRQQTYNELAQAKYSAKEMTRQQVLLFNRVIDNA